MHNFQVKTAGLLLDYLLKHWHGIKRSTLKSYLESRFIFVNGKPVTQYNFSLKPGDEIQIEKDKQKAQAQELRSKLDILYEDDSLIVIQKPSGLLTVATESERTKTAFYQVYQYLKTSQKTFQKPVYIVHRLDKDASGVLILAKTLQAKEYLQDNWERFEKKYYAVVEGTLSKPEGEIRSYLKENQILRVFSSKEELPGSKLAVTRYKVLEHFRNRSLLEVTLKTGRKHQIRVHLASLGHPILGDRDYGNKSLSGRLALHAYQLTVHHPIRRTPMTFKTKMPRDLEILLK